MSHFDPMDARQLAALLVFMEYDPDEIVPTLVARYGLKHNDAVDLVAALLRTRIEHLDKTDEVRRSHLAAVAAEWDLTKTMH